MISLVWWMLVGHFVFDYPLQGDTTAREKNRHSTSDLQRFVPWYYWMTAHAMMHGAAVHLVTGNILLGWCECIVHWLTDWAKCENIIGIHTDQAIHIACKLLWAAVCVYA